MSSIESIHEQTGHQPGIDVPQVWILSTGEMHEGGTIHGVYADRDLARGAFVEAAQEIHDRFSIDDAHQASNGALQITGGCDWVSLEPHTIVTRPSLNS